MASRVIELTLSSYRCGAEAAGARSLIDAAAEGPTIAAAGINFACGNAGDRRV
jgi:hypothetical protein